MDLFTRLVILGLMVAVAWIALQRRYAFVVRLQAGVPRLARGKVTAAFLHEIGRVCREAGVSDGWVGGVRRGRRVALRFSRHIPPPCRQRLRNLWLQLG
jgi:hypothetical protein